MSFLNTQAGAQPQAQQPGMADACPHLTPLHPGADRACPSAAGPCFPRTRSRCPLPLLSHAGSSHSLASHTCIHVRDARTARGCSGRGAGQPGSAGDATGRQGLPLHPHFQQLSEFKNQGAIREEEGACTWLGVLLPFSPSPFFWKGVLLMLLWECIDEGLTAPTPFSGE